MKIKIKALSKLRRAFRAVVFKNMIQDKFDGKYPFDLKKQTKGFFKNFGEKNPDKIFYIVWRDGTGSGFFSNFMNALSHVQNAFNLGMIPIVDFQNFKTIYNEKSPVNGTANSWEYYFKQVSPYSLDEVYSSKNVFFCDGEIGRSSFDMKKMWQDHVKLQPEAEALLGKYLGQFENKKILGVHFRGKELNIAPLHNFGATPEQMFKATDEIIAKHKIDKIFFVSEDKDYFDLFVKKYGDMLIFTDAFRVAKINAYNITPRENHRYLLGLEILVESILLSRCNVLLHASSNVSHHAQLLGNHESVYFIDNGRNSRGRYSSRYLYSIKKLLPKGFGGLKGEITVTSKDQ